MGVVLGGEEARGWMGGGAKDNERTTGQNFA